MIFQPQKSGAGFLVRDFCPGFARAESGAGFWEIPHQLVQDFTLRSGHGHCSEIQISKAASPQNIELVIWNRFPEFSSGSCA